MTDPYFGREQTEAKHYILGRYLQALAFKVLTFSDIAYVDGFSGPWETKTKNLSDTSFMIAISILRDAQTQILSRSGQRRRIRCFFCERNVKDICIDLAAAGKIRNTWGGGNRKPGDEHTIGLTDHRS